MRFFDLHVHSAFSGGRSSLDQIAETAKSLGYSGICFSAYYEGDAQLKRLREEVSKASEKFKIKIFLGFEARNPGELEKLRQIRRRFDVLLVRGGDIKLNRLAAETPEVDVLTHPEMGRSDPGMNDVLFRLAARNGVALEVNFREVMEASKGTRAKVIRSISQNVILAKRLKAPIVACSGALSHFELKDPLVLSSFVSLLGLSPKDSAMCVSKNPEKILSESQRRKDERWVMPGVKVV